jgi:hypothetical protein
MSRDWRVSVCGLNCASCDIYNASHGDEKLRKEIRDWFKDKRGEHFTLEQIRCEGCRCLPELNWSGDCPMQICARKRGLTYCFECSVFPCGHLEKFATDGIEHHRKTVVNLCAMRRLGLEEWTRRQSKPSFCP